MRDDSGERETEKQETERKRRRDKGELREKKREATRVRRKGMRKREGRPRENGRMREIGRETECEKDEGDRGVGRKERKGKRTIREHSVHWCF